MLRPDAVFDSVVSGIIFVSCRLRRRPASAENSQERGLRTGACKYTLLSNNNG